MVSSFPLTSFVTFKVCLILETSPLKQWSPTLLATALVVSEQFVTDSNNHVADSTLNNAKIQCAREEETRVESKWSTGCNPCNNNSTQIVPLAREQAKINEKEEVVDSSIFYASSILQGAEGLSDGSLSANVSSSQIEELVMQDSDDKSKPLVILFGWAGCRDRYLAKYSAYYQEKGLVNFWRISAN